MKKFKLFLLVILIALIFNLIWEFLHYQLYIDSSGITKVPHLILASLSDALIILVFFIIISLVHKSIKWIKKPSSLDYLLIILFGLITATTIEIINLNLGRWAYRSIMPTILGIGLSPLVQLSITGILTAILIKKYIIK